MEAVKLFVSKSLCVIQFLLCRVRHIYFLIPSGLIGDGEWAHLSLNAASSLTYSALTYSALKYEVIVP